jgi:hypothetical protein
MQLIAEKTLLKDCVMVKMHITCSLHLTIWSYAMHTESIPYPHTLFYKIHFNITPMTMSDRK